MTLTQTKLSFVGWYIGLLWDNALGISEKPDVQRKRGAELRNHLVQSRSVALIKVSQFIHKT
jgi:hypothetical protein